MDVEAEIRDLKRRVGELEGSFGFRTTQVRAVHRDLLAFQEDTDARFDKVDARLDKMDGRLNNVDGRLDRLEGRVEILTEDVRGLRQELPTIVGDVMREVLRDSRT